MRTDCDSECARSTPDAAACREQASRRAQLSPRRRFRARLDGDPRRWVLFIVSVEGLVAPMLTLSEKRDLLLSRGFGPAFLLVVMATLPATAVLTMLVHGRLLHWTGRLLGGSARPHEIHAAFAWSQAPLVTVGWPLLVEVPLRAVAADLDPVPRWLSSAISFAERASGPVTFVAVVAAAMGGFLWVKYLAEAQRFSSWRAIANHALAAACGIGLLLGAIKLAVALVPRGNAMIYGAIGSGIVLAVIGAATLALRKRREAPPAP